jgi:hypothetical protein
MTKIQVQYNFDRCLAGSGGASRCGPAGPTSGVDGEQILRMLPDPRQQ